ncbi:MAG TPA: hypothetical protein VM364_21075 [Vicinamibacterales bacterium]|nr:hypothetical protein [Vicinamibacterales bacterium]
MIDDPTTDPELEDEQDEAAHLAQVARRLQASRVNLIRTVRALQEKRYTPEEIQAIRDRSSRLVRRAQLLLLQIRVRFTVH